MECDACRGTGKTKVKATYNSNWHGKAETELQQTCYKCGGSGEVNSALGLQEPAYQQQIGGRTERLDDGIEK